MEKKGKFDILISTGDHDLAKSLTLLLQDQYKVQSTSILAKATEVVERREVDLLLADLGLSLDAGLCELKKMKESNPEIPIIVLCPYQVRNSGVEAEIRQHVSSFFHMPVNVEEITRAISKLLGPRTKSVNLVSAQK